MNLRGRSLLSGRWNGWPFVHSVLTPRVSLVPPDGLVLEVKGSLHLFNGVEGLSRALASECALLGLKSMVALSPTPLAALVAARVGKPFIVTELTRLVGQLMPLPLAALRWPQETFERLARMGVRTIGQVLRLPRAGFHAAFRHRLARDARPAHWS